MLTKLESKEQVPWIQNKQFWAIPLFHSSLFSLLAFCKAGSSSWSFWPVTMHQRALTIETLKVPASSMGSPFRFSRFWQSFETWKWFLATIKVNAAFSNRPTVLPEACAINFYIENLYVNVVRWWMRWLSVTSTQCNKSRQVQWTCPVRGVSKVFPLWLVVSVFSKY